MDLFGIKKRKAAKEARIQGYAETYRGMSEERRNIHADALFHVVRTGFFRNNAVVEQLGAAARVCIEEAEAAAVEAEAAYKRVCIEEAEAVEGVRTLH